VYSLAKVRVFALAKELGLKSSSLIKALSHMGVANLTPASAIDEDTATAVRELLAEQLAKARERVKEEQKPAAATTQQPAAAETEHAAVAAPPQAAEAIAPDKSVKASPAAPEAEDEDEIRKREEELAVLERQMAGHGFGPSHPAAYSSIDELEQRMAQAEATADAEPRPDAVLPLPELAKRHSGQRPEGAIEVPPVVTVLGHVDHGKTSLLDALRQTRVVASESGGITQHVGASELEVDGRRIVFIDTPGHQAFTAIRARGAQITDIAVLIIAADDGIMPQTVEAINHAKAANVPIIVAINKCDLPTANPERVKQQLLEYELVPEEWGGETIVVEISATTGQGLDDLVEMLLLMGEVQELWAKPQADFVAVVIEAGVATSEGAVCTLLTRSGTIHVGDSVVVGPHFGRVRRLRDWRGKSVKEMGPGRPVEVVGLSGTPDAGDIVIRALGPKEAREIAGAHEVQARQQDFEASRAAALRELFAGMRAGDVEQLSVIIKADVYGSAQALEASLMDLDSHLDEIDIEVIHVGVGPVTESDVMLARASNAIILAFRVDRAPAVNHTAEIEGVEIRPYKVIYEVLDDIVAAVSGMLKPVIETRPIGRAEVLQIFRSSRAGVVAGCRVIDGRLQPNAKINVVRDGESVYKGILDSLRRFEQDVSQVQAPSECGVATNGFRGWQVGDIIEATIEVEIERRVSVTGEVRLQRD
jgi:translation initiation factor IF-2